MANIQEAIEYAKKNPTSSFANELKRRIESGQMNNELKAAGLTQYLAPEKETLSSKLVERAKTVASEVTGAPARKLIKEAQPGEEPLVAAEALTRTAQAPIRAVGEVGGAIGDVFAAGLEATGLDEKAGKLLSPIVQSEPIKKAIDVYKNLPQETQDVLASIFNAANIPLAGVGAAGAKTVAEAGVSAAAKGAKTVAEAPIIKGAINVTKMAGENVAPRIINSLIKPLAKDFAYGKNPGKAVAELVAPANDFEGLISNISSTLDGVGSRIGSVVNQSQNLKQIDLSYTLKAIDEAINNANKTPRTNAGLISRLEGVKSDLVDNIQSGIDPQSYKKLIGDLTKWTGNASDDQAVNKALKQTYGSTRQVMDDVLSKELSPEQFAQYKADSEAYGNLLSAKNAAEYRDKINERQNLISFGAKNAGLLTGVMTAVSTGGAGVPAILAGLAGAGIDKALATPAFKTRLASLLSKLAPKDVSTFFDTVPTAKSLFTEQQIKDFTGELKKNTKLNQGMVNPSELLPKKTNALLQEAKKYKSVEEFVKAQGTPLYHGTEVVFSDFKPSSAGEIGKGVYFYDDANRASNYAGKSGRIIEAYVKGKMASLEDFRKVKKELGDNSWTSSKTIDELSKRGFIGIKRVDGGTIDYNIFDPKNIKTKDELIEIWNKANEVKPTVKTIISPLEQEAKKYKSVEEFVKAQGEKVYRGGAQPFDIKMVGKDGVFVSPSEYMASTFGKTVNELYISPKAKILTYDKLPKEFKDLGWDEAAQKISEYAKKNGYDVVDSLPPNVDYPRGMERHVINPEVLTTKSQLTDIWNKAKGKSN